ncbi:MAG: crossover junction endodeoxyribonuclease RuvC [Candidatus Cloacimonetes bacterium]|nr:crossover junction endodeoxyribonuclease RuvC [Candidatus Cloacimonadota bacterium]
MIILGIDPGSRFCGYGLLQVENRRIVAAGSDTIRIPARWPLERKLVRLREEIAKVIAEHKPDAAAVETIYFGKNVRTAFTQGHVRGVILLALAEAGVTVYDYTPSEIKKAVVGNGRASKQQVRYMVQQILGLSTPPETEDAADALAIALCHNNHRQATGLFK